MPLYEFQCDKCGMSDTRMLTLAELNEQCDKQKCTNCKAKLRKIISVPTILGTDTKLFLSHNDDGFGNDMRGRAMAKAKARAAGVSTAGKTFVPGLCRRGKSYDPQAWVSDKSEVVKKAETLGRNVDGCITHQTPIRDADYAKVEAPYRVSAKTIMPEVQLENERRHGGKATKAQLDNLIQEKIEIHSGN